MVSITIRDLPQHTYDALVERAAHEGLSVEEYVRAYLMRLAESPRAAGRR